MAWVVTAITVNAVIGGGTNYLGSKANSDAINNASNLQNTASQNSLALQEKEFNAMQANLAPWLASGTNNLNTLNSLMPSLSKPFSFSDYTQSPSYAWQLSQGKDALESSAAGRGGLFSGATGKAMTEYGQNLANTDYQQALNNYNAANLNKYNMLVGLANQSAVNSANNAAQTYANNYTNTAMGTASSLGQLGLASGQNTANMYSNYNNMLNSSLGMGLNYSMLNNTGSGSTNYDFGNGMPSGGTYVNGAIFN